ncbi:hypothetical protein BKA61DRAFT_683617 [Leptodontidium sp. MPI-SDFR-AT-0119]|nr:hypothetical protein BKA61DRAFT_683617 [Leptodontidium sp. MPI-SDFR-AT-0119]
MALVIIVELYAKDTAAAIDTLKRTLVEATGIYTKDQGTLEWRPIQDTADKRAFRVFEKFESQAAFQVHRENPYRQNFLGALKDALDKPPQQGNYEELV